MTVLTFNRLKMTGKNICMYIYYDQRASDKKTIIVTLIIDLIEDNHLIL